MFVRRWELKQRYIAVSTTLYAAGSVKEKLCLKIVQRYLSYTRVRGTDSTSINEFYAITTEELGVFRIWPWPV